MKHFELEVKTDDEFGVSKMNVVLEDDEIEVIKNANKDGKFKETNFKKVKNEI
jgi:hypothetical protein